MMINKEWHEKNRMPKNPTIEQRINWHLEHQKNCLCMPIPKKLAEEMRKRVSSCSIVASSLRCMGGSVHALALSPAKSL